MSLHKSITFSVEGLTSTKAQLLIRLKAILCLQETHKDSIPPNIPGMHLIVHHASRVHGSAIYARERFSIILSNDLSHGEIEILQVRMKQITIISVYKSPPVPFDWPVNHNIDTQICLILGDFNSHSTSCTTPTVKLLRGEQLTDTLISSMAPKMSHHFKVLAGVEVTLL